MADAGKVECPVCCKRFVSSLINVHVNRCLAANEEDKNTTVNAENVIETRKRKSSSPPNSHEKKHKSTSVLNKLINKNCHTKTDFVAEGKESPLLIEGSSSESSEEYFVESSTSHSNGHRHMQNTNGQPSTRATVNIPKKTFSIFQPRENPGHQATTFNLTTSQENHEAKPGKTAGINMPDIDSNKPLLSMNIPLAEQMRPKTFTEYTGQKSAERGSILRLLLDSDRIPSMILWGPPGCGKTTLARIIANRCKSKEKTKFVPLSASTAGVHDVKEMIKVAKTDMNIFRKKTILFIDEIHRFNKTQQDVLLPHVEDGTVTLIGATTENPSFQLNTALLSRCRVIILEKLSVEAVETILKRALDTLGVNICESVDDVLTAQSGVYIDRKAVHTLAHLCDGDARVALNGLQMAVQSQIPQTEQSEGKLQDRMGPVIGSCGHCCVVIQTEHIKEGLQRSHVLYDRAGEEHYNIVSAMIKSMRGSDDSAALYWMTRMLDGGEDPRFIARRLVIFASEDVGLADPSALNLAMSSYQACQVIGMPECGLIMAECVVYLARAPKSVEAYQAYKNARNCVRNHEGPLPSVPLHLRNAPTSMMKDMGYGSGYKYNPSFSKPVKQDYFPKELIGTNFFK